MGGDPYFTHRLESTLTVLRALATALQNLQTYYTEAMFAAVLAPEVSRMFPYPRSYRDSDGNYIAFEYLIKLAEHDLTKAVFKAKITTTGEFVVVKFVSRQSASPPRRPAIRAAIAL